MSLAGVGETDAMSSNVDSYPCPFCGTIAAVESGCPGCGRGPDAEAIEVIRLNAELAGLGARLEEARAAVRAVEVRIGEVRGRRDALAFRVRSAQSLPLPAPPLPPLPSMPATEPRLTTLTAQNVLFALGGLLLVSYTHRCACGSPFRRTS